VLQPRKLEIPLAELPRCLRRRSILRWGEECYVSELHLVPSSWISEACTRLGLTIVERHSTPDQAMPDHSGVLLVARKP